MAREELKVEKREILGKKVAKLRKHGILPANVFGKDMESQSVQLATKDFIDLYKKAGKTNIIDLVLEGKKIPTLVSNLQMNHKTQSVLHVDFHKVNLKQKITTHIPIVPFGEAKAVTDKTGVLLQSLDQIEVEALPTELPEKIEVNVEPLSSVDEHINVADIVAPDGVTVLTDPTQTVFKITELVSVEAKEQAAEEELAAEEASADEAAKETETTEEASAQEPSTSK